MAAITAADVSFQRVYTSDPRLNRMQDAIAEALRRLVGVTLSSAPVSVPLQLTWHDDQEVIHLQEDMREALQSLRAGEYVFQESHFEQRELQAIQESFRQALRRILAA